MSFRIFDFDMVDKNTLVVGEDERLVRLISSNQCNSDYCIVPNGMDDDELDSELALSFRKRYGKSSYGPFYEGYEDVSYLLEEM